MDLWPLAAIDEELIFSDDSTRGFNTIVHLIYGVQLLNVSAYKGIVDN